MLSKMSTGNFNWFLHTMLFLHTQQVIQRQEEKRIRSENEEDEEDDDDDEQELGLEMNDDN
jgi:hypothetical protein